MSRRHAVIPDCQVKPGVPTDHLVWAAQYIVEKKPDVIVCLGDFADMPSLCSYDVGKKSFEGRRYTADIEAARKGMERFISPIRKEQERLRKNKEKTWNLELYITLGNHENRINKAVDNDAKIEGVIGIKDLGYEGFGWTVVPFLKVINIDNVAYSHYFVSGVLGRPVTSARALLSKHHMSCVAGHQQGKDIAYAQTADGRQMTGIISGSFYEHEEAYLTPQSNIHWRGIWFLNDVQSGSFDELPVSLDYLKRRYGQ